MAQLVQILLPVYGKNGGRLPRTRFEITRKELIAKFGGLTSYARAPAKGFWRKSRTTERDDIVVFEVMTARVAVDWWRRYRKRLERRFEQDEVIVRSLSYRKL